MIGYAMVGASDPQRSSDYYDAVLKPLGLVQIESNSPYVGYTTGMKWTCVFGNDSLRSSSLWKICSSMWILWVRSR